MIGTETFKKIDVECACEQSKQVCILEGTVPVLVPGNLTTPKTVVVEKVTISHFGVRCSVANDVGIDAGKERCIVRRDR